MNETLITDIAMKNRYQINDAVPGLVQLFPDPTNKHDVHAIKIMQGHLMIGYVPRDINLYVDFNTIAILQENKFLKLIFKDEIEE